MLLPGAEALPLDDALAHYRRFGWARLGPVAAPEALESLRRRADQLMLGEVVQPGLFFQHDAATGLYEDIPRGQGWQGPSLRYRKLEKLELDPLFAAWIGNPLFGRIAHAVVGPEVSLCRAVLFTKAASGGTELPWHQDAGNFWGLSRDPELQLWTALDDAPAAAGCLEIVPGTHLAGRATPEGGVIPDEVVAHSGRLEQSVLAPARAGEALLIHNHVWHRSGRNATAAPRRGLTICVMDAATRCTRRRSPRKFPRLYGP